MSVFDSHDALGLAEMVRAGEVSPAELLDEAIERVEQVDQTLHLTAYRTHGFARKQIADGLPEGPFTGVPFMMKDVEGDIEGLPMSLGIRLLKDFTAPVTKVHAQRYLDAGLVVFGTTKVPPFAMTYDTFGSHYGACGNPWDPTKTPAGSSSGAGAVVGSGAIPMAHGNDGGGSLRVPAAWNGAFAVKPSRGRVPNGPVYTEGWLGFSCEGTITRSVRDCAAALDATRGYELGARYSAPEPARSYLEETQHDCRPLRIALVERLHDGGEYDPEYLELARATGRMLEDLGHTVEVAQPAIPIRELDQALFKVIAVEIANAIGAVGQLLGRPIEPGEIEPLVRTVGAMAPGVTGRDYSAVNTMAMETSYTVATFMKDYDLILSPTSPMRPQPIGDIYTVENDFDRFMDKQHPALCFTVVANLTGQPAMSVPLHHTGDGMPAGMMFMGRYGDESTLFSLAAQLERAHPWAARTPGFFCGEYYGDVRRVPRSASDRRVDVARAMGHDAVRSGGTGAR